MFQQQEMAKIYCQILGRQIIIPDMRNGTQILVETTKSQKQALASVLKENGATLTEWFTDNIAEATADFSVDPIETPQDPPSLESLADANKVFSQLKLLDWAFSDDDTTY